jgi:hypothetical protein
MMEAVRTSETSVDNHFTRQYIPEDNSEHHIRRRENLKSHLLYLVRNQPVVVSSTVNITRHTQKKLTKITRMPAFILYIIFSRLCHYSVGGAWLHLGFYESFSTLCG